MPYINELCNGHKKLNFVENKCARENSVNAKNKIMLNLQHTLLFPLYHNVVNGISLMKT